MNRKICILLLILLLSLSACAQKTPEAPQIGVCFQNSQDNLTVRYRDALLGTLEEAGYRVVTKDGKNDQTIQNRQVAELLEDCDLLIIEPVMIAGAADLVAQLKSADKPAVFVNREPEDGVLESWHRACYVGDDAIQPGLLQGRMILDTPNRGDFNGDGIISYGIITGPEDHVDAALRSRYSVSELGFGGLEISHLATYGGDWTQEAGRRACARLLAEYGKNLEVIFCNNDALALGALEAIADGGRVVGENLYLVGVDADPAALEAVVAGAMTGTVSVDIPGQIAKILELVEALLAEQPVGSRYYTDCVPISSKNIADFIDEKSGS